GSSNSPPLRSSRLGIRPMADLGTASAIVEAFRKLPAKSNAGARGARAPHIRHMRGCTVGFRYTKNLGLRDRSIFLVRAELRRRSLLCPRRVGSNSVLGRFLHAA